MTHAYDKNYLAPAQKCLARMLDYMVNDLQCPLETAWNWFLTSNASHRFEIGDDLLYRLRLVIAGNKHGNLIHCFLLVFRCYPLIFRRPDSRKMSSHIILPVPLFDKLSLDARIRKSGVRVKL